MALRPFLNNFLHRDRLKFEVRTTCMPYFSRRTSGFFFTLHYSYKAASLWSRRSRVRPPLWHSSFKETKYTSPLTREYSILCSLRDREVACSASNHQGSNFEFCLRRTVSSNLSYHPHKVHVDQFSLYVHTGGLKPHIFIQVLYYTVHSIHWNRLKHWVWMKVIQFWQNRGQRFWNLAHWCHCWSSTCWKLVFNLLKKIKKPRIWSWPAVKK